ncbi:hypothetical protein XENTR_v10001117 [Xenopus tropicalis]|uniref:Shroom family member 3 n=1 Tax=Xenopus tropicalis TaxID=8364 RepID=A0A803JYF2_XENTR|nr:hypothetical protein XENTR_v10001117 [Xenopus tropicalis]
MMQISQGTIRSPWHQVYHSSSSTSDLSGYNHEFLRSNIAPDPYRSRGSMESLDQASAAYHHCHLSPAKSTNCIDQLVYLHNKRDSAYSSFSTNASIPEYHSSQFSKERSYSMESMHSRSSVPEGIKHADIKYIKTVYNVQRGISEYEVNSSSVMNRNYSRQPAYNRYSIGPHGRLNQSRMFSESDGFERSAPLPPTRSDSYALTRHHERSPLVKPKQIYSEAPQPGRPILPTGIYPVPAPEPHFAHAPQPPKNNNGRLYPALAKEGSYLAKSSEKLPPCSEFNENDAQHLGSKSLGHCSMDHSIKDKEKKHEGPTGFSHYKINFSVGPEIPTSSLTYDKNDQYPLSLHKNGTKMAEKNDSSVHTDAQNKSERHGFSVYAQPAFQNEWNDSKAKQSTNIMDLHRNSCSSDTQKENEYCNHLIIACSSPNKMDDRINRQADHRKKLTSLTFTVHVDDVNGPNSNQLKADKLPSPSQKKSYDFAKRRLSSSSSQSSKTDGNKLSSVLDKVCKIEQREQENQRSQVLCGNISQSGPSTRGQNNRGSLTMVEEIRNKFICLDQTYHNEWHRLSSSNSKERATGMNQITRHGSVHSIKRWDAEEQVEKMYSNNQEQNVLQIVPDDDKRSFESQTMPNKDDLQCAAQDTLGYNRAYRNSVKVAQCKVLEATSYRRKDLEISPPHYKKPENNERPASAPFRNKSSSLSPHAPKERHSVTPTDNCAGIQESQGVSFPSRIGAKRLITAEQKKRSYSEPEKMNKIGASEGKSAPLAVPKKHPNSSFLENSVEDRRRVFERDGKACSTTSLSKPQLKQLQQTALADYIQRKMGRSPSSQETRTLKESSQSTYFSGSIMDNQSLISTSSMNSLHEHSMSYRNRETMEMLSKTGRVSSTLPSGLTGFFDLSSFEDNTEYTDCRSRSNSFAHQLRSERLPDHRYKVEFGKSRETNKPQEATLQSDDVVGMTRSEQPGKFASAEDLLDRLPQPPALHVRSRSSPASDKKSREYMLRHDLSNKTLYALTSNNGTSFRSVKSNNSEQMSFQSSFKHNTDNEGQFPEKFLAVQRSVPLETQRNTNARSTSPSGTYNHHTEAMQVPLALPIHSVPAKVAQTSLTLTSLDYITAEEYLYSGKHGKESASPIDNKEKSHQEWCLPEKKSSEDFTDIERCAKYTSTQRLQPFKTEIANSINGTVQQNKSSGPSAGPKFSTSWKNNAMWSSSSSEAETTFHRGKISLHISESCLQSPMTGQEEEGDDEVFVKEQDTESFSGAVIPPSPPPFPPPSLEDALLQEKIEKYHFAPNILDETRENTEDISKDVNKKINERYHQSTSEYAESTESSVLYLLNSGITKRDTDIPLHRLSSVVPSNEPTASSVDPAKPTEEHVTHPHWADTSILSLERNFSFSDSHSTLPCVRTDFVSPEDAKSQELAKEIVTMDKSLANILDPDSKMKTTMDLIEGLFTKSSSALKEKNQKLKAKKQANNIIAPDSEKREEKRETHDIASSCSANYSTSAPKAELLRKMKSMHSQTEGEEEQFDVNEKKAELIASLTCKLEVLKDAKESLLDDIKLNNSLGEEVETLIETLCKPNEFDKYKMFIGDLDKVVHLLLSLSGRLARVENALSSLGEDANPDERNTWNEKKKQLCGQHEDACELKENLDRREKLVMDILGNYLTGEQFADYQHFVKMKAALLIEQRELDDKIKLGQEQLRCLKESLPY